jgi:hypothetical protein
MSLQIRTTGRTDVVAYFESSGVREWSRLNHTPFLAFVARDDCVCVEIVDSAKKLLAYPDETPVMGQWKGQWSSDFFQFTVGDFRTHVNAHPKANDRNGV